MSHFVTIAWAVMEAKTLKEFSQCCNRKGVRVTYHQSITSLTVPFFSFFLKIFWSPCLICTLSSCDYGSSWARVRSGKHSLPVISLLISRLTMSRACSFHRWCLVSPCMHATWDLVILQKPPCSCIKFWTNPRFAWQLIVFFPKNPLSLTEIQCKE